MKLVTVANKECPGLSLWRGSARLAGHDPVVLGLGDRTPLGHDAGGKFGAKFQLLGAWLRTLHPSELVVVTDGFDVIVVDGPAALEERVRAKLETHELWFSGELYENPDKGNAYRTRHRWFPFLNSGIYAGEAGTILRALSQFFALPADMQLGVDDQRYFTQIYLLGHPGLRIGIDHDAELFASLCGVPLEDAVPCKGGARMRNGNSPAVLHFQGYWKNVLPYATAMFQERDAALVAAAAAMHRTPGWYTPYVDAVMAFARRHASVRTLTVAALLLGFMVLLLRYHLKRSA